MSNIAIIFVLLNSLLFAEDLYNHTQTKCFKTDTIIKTIKLGNIKELEKKLDLSCNLYEKNKNEETLIFDAVRLNKKYIVPLLLSKGFNLYDINNKGQTLLHVAAKNNFYDIIDILMKNGLKDSRDNFGYLAKWYAYKQNSSESLVMIYKNEKNSSSQKIDNLDEFIKNFNKNPIDEM